MRIATVIAMCYLPASLILASASSSFFPVVLVSVLNPARLTAVVVVLQYKSSWVRRRQARYDGEGRETWVAVLIIMFLAFCTLVLMSVWDRRGQLALYGSLPWDKDARLLWQRSMIPRFQSDQCTVCMYSIQWIMAQWILMSWSLTICKSPTQKSRIRVGVRDTYHTLQLHCQRR